MARNVVETVRSESSAKRVAFVRVDALSFNLYPVEFCDACGAECVRTDGPTYHAENRAAVNRLSVMADHIGPLPAIGACDALGGIGVCPACYTDEDPNEKTQPFPAPILAPSGMPREFAEAIASALTETSRPAVAAWFRVYSGLAEK